MNTFTCQFEPQFHFLYLSSAGWIAVEIEELLKLQRRPKCAFGCREGERERITTKRIEMSKRCESESIGKPSNSEMFVGFFFL